MGNKTGKNIADQPTRTLVDGDVKVVAGGSEHWAPPSTSSTTWQSAEVAKTQLELEFGARQHALDLSVQLAQTHAAHSPARIQSNTEEIVKRAEAFHAFLSGEKEVDIDKMFRPLGRPEPEDQS